MSSKRAKRRHAEQTCKEKKGYTTRNKALAMMRIAVMHGERDMGVYLCKVCKLWHQGHLPAHVRKEISERRSMR